MNQWLAGLRGVCGARNFLKTVELIDYLDQRERSTVTTPPDIAFDHELQAAHEFCLSQARRAMRNIGTVAVGEPEAKDLPFFLQELERLCGEYLILLQKSERIPDVRQ